MHFTTNDILNAGQYSPYSHTRREMNRNQYHLDTAGLHKRGLQRVFEIFVAQKDSRVPGFIYITYKTTRL